MSKYSNLSAAELRVLLSAKEKAFSQKLHGPSNPFGEAYTKAEYQGLLKLLGDLGDLLETLSLVKVEKEIGDEE